MIIEVPTRNVLELYAEIDRTRSEIGRLRAVLEGVLEHADAKRDADCSDDFDRADIRFDKAIDHAREALAGTAPSGAVVPVLPTDADCEQRLRVKLAAWRKSGALPAMVRDIRRDALLVALAELVLAPLNPAERDAQRALTSKPKPDGAV